MANSYYGRIHQYLPRTRAMGENVREDYDSIVAGFDKLPTHNQSATGFDESFIVTNPISDQSPLPYHQFCKWPHDISAGGYRLTDVNYALNEGDAVNLADLKSHVYNWQYDVNAQDHQLKSLADPNEETDAVNIRYMKLYVDTQLKPEVPDGGLAWLAPVAKGGEMVLNPPYQFTIAELRINGVYQIQKRGAYTISNNIIYLSEPLQKGDEAVVILGAPRPSSDHARWNLVKDDYEIQAGDKILLDSKEKSFALTLPSPPTVNDSIYFLDVGNSLDRHPITINGNGQTIMGSSETMEIRTNAVSFQLLFIGGYGWRVLE